MRTLLIILSILWAILSWCIWIGIVRNCDTKPLKSQEVKVEQKVEEKVLVEPIKPISFNWGAESDILAANHKEYIQDIVSKRGDFDELIVTGMYAEEEPNSTRFENLGIARAEAVKPLFADKMDTANIVARGRKVSSLALDKDESFEALVFKWRDSNKTVETVEDGVIIYHKFNSSQKTSDPQIDQYLVKLVNDLKANPAWTVELVGHTDNSGPDYTNERLGLDRANRIKSIITREGISADRVKTASEGEKDPMTTNSTKEGRAKNRRTEVKITKK